MRCRGAWPFLTNERSQTAVEVAERHADEPLPDDELELVRRDARAFRAAMTPACRDAQGPRTATCAGARAGTPRPGPHSSRQTPPGAPGVDFIAAFDRTHRAQAVLIPNVFGNLFCSITFDPAGRTSDVLALARGIYEEAFDRMPILADALQDAGCNSGALLNYCRGNGPHVRGCRVADLILEKEYARLSRAYSY